MNSFEEEWRKLEWGLGNYYISNLGRVKNLKTGMVLSPNRSGAAREYLSVCLYSKNISKRFLIHRLVCAAFLGDISGKEANHKDFNKQNNAFWNLEIVSHAENMTHAGMGGRMKTESRPGESNYNSKLTREQAIEIIKRRKAGERRKDLAKEYGVSTGPIDQIFYGISWKELDAYRV